MNDPGVLEEIKTRIEVVDFISRYVKLNKSGQNWKGLCPFHSEKTPSFMVNPGKQIFHCFGCGAGGDVITFLMKYENVSFYEAIKTLAQNAGITLPAGRDGRNVEKSERFRNALEEACTFYRNRLLNTDEVQQYLSKRGINDESSALFRIGFAPQGWNNIVNHLRKLGFSDDVIQGAGLAVPGTRGLYDMFRNRLMFPILSPAGNIMAFGGRVLEDGTGKADFSAPKYINSPETQVFRKSETLFGLHTAKEAVRSENRVIIVEGYMDVVVSVQHGFRNVVAPLGTALTAGHMKKLRAFTTNVLLVFDGDAAGRAAAKRALPVICENDVRAKVLVLPDNEDPDSFLRKKGGTLFSEILEKAESVVDFIFSDQGKNNPETVREALSLISLVRDPLFAGELLVQVSDKTRIHESTLREEFRKLRSPGSANRSVSKTALSPAYSEEYLLLSTVLAFPEKTNDVLHGFDYESIQDRVLRSLFGKLAGLSEKKDFPKTVLEGSAEEEKAVVMRLLADPGFDPEHLSKNIEDCLKRIHRRKVDQENRNLDERIKNAEISGDLQLITTLLIEKKRKIKEAGL